MKHSTLARRSRPGRAGTLVRTGLVGITAGLVLAVGTAAGASASTVRAVHVSAAPAAPADLVAAAGPGQVSLSWTASTSGATSYDVYAGTTSAFQASTKLATVRGLDYTATNLQNGTRYYFWVTAANGTGTSASSDLASATPSATTTPGAPVSLKATPGQGQVTLSWVAPASSGVSPVTSYNIYVGTTPAFRGGLPRFVSMGEGTSYVVTGLSAGTTYYFEVAAVNAHGAGPASPVASAAPPAQVKPAIPGAPGHVIAQPGRTRMIVMWTAPAASGGAKVSGYLVYMGTRPGGESGTPVTRVLIHDTACAVMGLASTITYYFKVAAVDATGHPGPLSAEVSGVPWPAVTPSHPGPSTPVQPTGPAQVVPTQPSPPSATQDANRTQDHSSPGTPAGLIILLAGVATAALAGAVGMTLHLRRMRTRQDMPEALEPDELTGPRYR